jgi:dipeptidyl-peptidase-4
VSDTYPRQSARTRRFTLGAPRDLAVATDGSRVAFLRSPAGDDPVNALWVLDVATEELRCVADPRTVLALDEPHDIEETAAERARRERAREAAGGIVTYHADPALTRAVFVLGGRLFRADLLTGATAELPVHGSAFDPRLDPTGTRVAYVSGSGLRSIELDGTGDRLVVGADDPDITWGSAEFVAAEEMHRSRGYWWGPSGAHVLAARVDTTPVPVWWISSPAEPWAEPRPVRYPNAGADNAAVSLAIVGLDGTHVDVDWAQGEFEYLADAMWAPRERPTLVVQTRDQRTLAVLDVDPATGAVTEVHRRHDPHWVELVPGAPAWAGDRLLTVVDRDGARRVCVDGEPITPADVQVRRVLHVAGDVVYVAATTEPTEVHVARCTLDGGEFTWLTYEPGVHNAVIGGDLQVVSSATLGRAGNVVRVRRDELVVTRIGSLAETPVVEPQVEIHTVGDLELRVALVLPRDVPADVKLPVLLDPYGGPHALRVQKSFNAFATSQWFADQGFAVIVCDGRGTPARGPEWERAVRGDFATPVLDDQVTALHEMADRCAQLDLSRVGIRGWSFGGYLAALAVLRRPDVFHAAVAGAPVTEWGLYDTHYTERYLGDPRTEPDNYTRSDLVPLAPRLERPLLLVHGLADDNVVAAHTLRLSRALLEAGRSHRVVPLSGVTHMTPQETVAANLLQLEIDFFREALGIGPPEPAYRWKPMLPRRGGNL